MKTESEIKDDIISHIKSTQLATEVTGQVLKRLRPKNSDKEDVIITVLGAIPMDQQQEVPVNVNIYVRERLQDGQYAPDEPRERKLQKIAEQSLKVGGIGKSYGFTLVSQQTFEVDESDKHERCINNRILYTYYNED